MKRTGVKHRLFYRPDIEVRADEQSSGLPILRGHAIVANTISDAAGVWTEEVSPEAITKALARNSEVVALWNHRDDFPLQRTPKLKMQQDEKGLLVEFQPSDTSYARDLIANIESGVVKAMSFGFYLLEESRQVNPEGIDHYIIEDFELFDVSPVTYPFYKETDIDIKKSDIYKARSLGEQKKDKKSGCRKVFYNMMLLEEEQELDELE